MAAVERLRVPPHSVEAERALLGALLLDPSAWVRVAGRLGPDDCFRSEHARLCAAIARQADHGTCSDVAVLVDSLERAGELDACGGRDYIAGLVEAVGSTANVEAYADRVREYALLRQLVAVAGDIGRMAIAPTERTAAELVAMAAQRIHALVSPTHGPGQGLVAARDLASALLDDLEQRRERECGLSVGLADFDRLTSGLEPGDLVVLAGRPGMGKTALLVSMALHVGRSTGVAVFSAEMPSAQLTRRGVALLGSVAQSTLRRPQELTEGEWSTVSDAVCRMGQRRLWIDDTPAPTLAHIRATTMTLAAREELGLILIDYMQLVRGEGANRYEQLRDVAYGTKAFAKEMGVPVIALAQLNRGVERRDNRRATLSDLRDSGAIEEAADIIGMLYCEGYYDPEFGMPYVLECAIEKNRNGERGQCLWHFTGEFSRVRTLDSGAAAQYRRALAKRKRSYSDDL